MATKKTDRIYGHCPECGHEGWIDPDEEVLNDCANCGVAFRLMLIDREKDKE